MEIRCAGEIANTAGGLMGGLMFTRGSILGDFSIKIAKIEIDISLPITETVDVRILYGAFAAFDTGDLSQFSRELDARLLSPSVELTAMPKTSATPPQ